MKASPYEVLKEKKVRVIIDTDAYCEADDQYAIVHHLMTPKFEVTGIVATHFADRFCPDSEGESFGEVKRILKLMDLDQKIPVYHGCKVALPDEKTPNISEASEFIIREALKEDDRPLFIAGQAALSNVASAYLSCPQIAEKVTLVWIGGGTYPDGESEFNLENDVNAANVVFGSGMEIWQIPKNVYSKMTVPLSVLYDKVYSCGKLGEYLLEVVHRANETFTAWIKRPGYSNAAFSASYPGGEMWIMGDSPTVGVIMFDERYSFHTRTAPRFKADGSYDFPENGRRIRVYDVIDREFIMNDFYSKLKYYFRE